MIRYTNSGAGERTSRCEKVWCQSAWNNPVTSIQPMHCTLCTV